MIPWIPEISVSTHIRHYTIQSKSLQTETFFQDYESSDHVSTDQLNYSIYV